MKRLIIILTVVLLTNQSVWLSAAGSDNKTVEGTIKSISIANAALGTKSEIQVLDKQGHKYIFLIKATTRIYDSNANATTLEKLKPGLKVRIKYSTTHEGVNEAISLKILIAWLY